ncbi:MAG: carboxypeptidase-like regulatory domain-containing protein [Candidatus Hydrogenedentes bacterium]|nr:carboxypeptidase-like regulatory domain-containing protein [Candidatus Hydrogenedentota bacterium]
MLWIIRGVRGVIFFSLLLASCEMVIFRIEGEVVDINGEPLPGVCVSSSQTFDYAITDAKGKFYFTSLKPVSKIDLIKSDYLPIRIELTQMQNAKVNLGKITLVLKPFTQGVYYYDRLSKRYIMLSYSQVKRVKFEENIFLPSVARNEIVKVKVSPLTLYVYKMPHYDVKLYRMKLVDLKIDKSGEGKLKDKTEKEEQSQVFVPDEPVMVHTRFISMVDNTLFIIEPLRELEPGYYCINWGAFETPFPKIPDNYLFEYEDESNEEK